MNVNLSSPVFLVKGSDDVILGDEVSALVAQLLGDDDRTLLLAELSINDHALDDGGYTGYVGIEYEGKEVNHIFKTFGLFSYTSKENVFFD